MEFNYTLTEAGIRIDKAAEAKALVEIPEELDGHPVTELGPYVLAESVVEELRLPPGLVKIGAYAFYNCVNLKKIYCYSRVKDLGTGMFAGSRGAEFLDFSEVEGEKSYLKDMLTELRQTLRVRIHGTHEARLIFPEYFEESVENTPARILVIETHGCGHRYRYCFDNREFQYRNYDALFPHVQVQESELLVTELALGRVLYPCGLTEANGAMYRAYIKEHWKTAAQLMIDADRLRDSVSNNLDSGLIPWFAEHYIESEDQLQTLIDMAQKAGDTETVIWLMNERHERFCCEETSGRPAVRGKRRFEL